MWVFCLVISFSKNFIASRILQNFSIFVIAWSKSRTFRLNTGRKIYTNKIYTFHILQIFVLLNSSCCVVLQLLWRKSLWELIWQYFHFSVFVLKIGSPITNIFSLFFYHQTRKKGQPKTFLSPQPRTNEKEMSKWD